MFDGVYFARMMAKVSIRFTGFHDDILKVAFLFERRGLPGALCGDTSSAPHNVRASYRFVRNCGQGCSRLAGKDWNDHDDLRRGVP